jgi:hypothetical protein
MQKDVLIARLPPRYLAHLGCYSCHEGCSLRRCTATAITSASTCFEERGMCQVSEVMDGLVGIWTG